MKFSELSEREINQTLLKTLLGEEPKFDQTDLLKMLISSASTNLVVEQNDSDLLKHDVIAQGRYMDKQKTNSDFDEGGTQEASLPPKETLQTPIVSPVASTVSIKDLKMQILSQLPELLSHQQCCITKEEGSQCSLN